MQYFSSILQIMTAMYRKIREREREKEREREEREIERER